MTTQEILALPDESTNLLEPGVPRPGVSEAERLGVRAVAMLALKKNYTAGQAISILAADGRLWSGCQDSHVRSGTGQLSQYWVVPMANKEDCQSGQPLFARSLRSFVGFEEKPAGLFIVYL